MNREILGSETALCDAVMIDTCHSPYICPSPSRVKSQEGTTLMHTVAGGADVSVQVHLCYKVPLGWDGGSLHPCGQQEHRESLHLPPNCVMTLKLL